MGRKPKPQPIDVGDIVYLITDPDTYPPQVVKVVVNYPSGMARYKLACGDKFSTHYEFELSREVEDRLRIKGFTQSPKKPRRSRTKNNKNSCNKQ